MEAKSEILTYINNVGRAVEPHELGKELGYSRVTIHKHLKNLVSEGVLSSEGQAPHTTYRRTEQQYNGYSIQPRFPEGFIDYPSSSGIIANYIVKKGDKFAIFVFYVPFLEGLVFNEIDEGSFANLALIRIKAHILERGILPYDEYIYELRGREFVEFDTAPYYTKTLKDLFKYTPDIQKKLLAKNYFKQFCEKHELGYIGYFGSYARGDAKGHSDLDILVSIKEGIQYEYNHYYNWIEMRKELKKYFGVNVDMINNWNIKQAYKPNIFNDLKDLYGTRPQL